MEKWEMKKYELQNNGIDVFQNYHDTDRQWKKFRVYKRYLPKDFLEDGRFQ